MQLAQAIERLERVASTCGEPAASTAELKAALAATTQVRGYLDACRAELVRALDRQPTAFPEQAIAETSGCSLGHATKEKERATTLDAAHAVGEALSDGAITSGHVDALTRATRNLDESATAALLGDDITLAVAASTRTIAQFDAYVKCKAKALDRSDAEERLDRQRRATRLRHWVDGDGMWNLKGKFDPETGKDLAKALAARASAKFAEQLPESAPSDPIERVQHLEALALVDLILADGVVGGRPGPPSVVVDASQSDGAGGPAVDWGIPVELPVSVLHDLFDVHDPDVVVVANGVVLYAPGEMNLGRSTRLASREQRRALAGLYATCAVPGCVVHYDRCRLHHVVFWHRGGRTDFENLLPVCQHHHTRLHTDGWRISLGPNRELTIGLPDGQVLRTGPPRRSAA